MTSNKKIALNMNNKMNNNRSIHVLLFNQL